MSGFEHHFGYAKVGTFGLAHSLLAWARCRIWCDSHRVPMLAPSWLHIQHRIGPILRGERDKRQYHRLFLFPGYVVGLRRLYLLSTLRRVDADTTDLGVELRNIPTRLVVFSNHPAINEEMHFHKIVSHNARILSALTAITKPRYLPPLLSIAHIAIHVRLGDFADPRSVEALRSGTTNARLPLEWYRDMLSASRGALGELPARVYSDGSDELLKPLLSMPNVSRSPSQASITDLLSIAQAAMLISSGSGFSRWGAYLGSVPRISFPGQRFIRVLVQRDGVDLEPECEGAADLSEGFLQYVKSRMSASHKA